MRMLPLVMALTGCTFYISGGAGDAGGSGSGTDSFVQPDAEIADAPVDVVTPPLGDAPVDSLFPPFDAFNLDGLIPPLDGLIPPLDGLIPPLDAMPPPDAPTTTTPIETMIIPCNGQVVVSQQTYSSSLNYRVRASGQCKVDDVFGGSILADAEYQGTIVPRDKDNGIDTGIALYDATLGPNKNPKWGNYTSTHVYEVTGPGYDVPVTARYHDNANNAYGNNTGSLTLEIFLQ